MENLGFLLGSEGLTLVHGNPLLDSLGLVSSDLREFLGFLLGLSASFAFQEQAEGLWPSQ